LLNKRQAQDFLPSLEPESGRLAPGEIILSQKMSIFP